MKPVLLLSEEPLNTLLMKPKDLYTMLFVFYVPPLKTIKSFMEVEMPKFKWPLLSTNTPKQLKEKPL